MSSSDSSNNGRCHYRTDQHSSTQSRSNHAESVSSTSPLSQKQPSGNAADKFVGRQWVWTKLLQWLGRGREMKGILVSGCSGSGKSALCRALANPSMLDDGGSMHFQQLRKRVVAVIECRRSSYDHESVMTSLVSQVKPWLSKSAGETSQLNSLSAAIKALACIQPPWEQQLFVLDCCEHPQILAELRVVLAGNAWPPWLTLLTTARNSCPMVVEVLSGFRRLRLDDTRKRLVLQDLQQFILHSIDCSPKLRGKLSGSEAVSALQMLHIKANGCMLYVHKILDLLSNDQIALSDLASIPSTLNGLFVWLCNHFCPRPLFAAEIRPALSVLLAADHAALTLCLDDLLLCLQLCECPFSSRAHQILERIFVVINRTAPPSSRDQQCTVKDNMQASGEMGANMQIFHSSFADFVQDVKYCTSAYLCDLAQGYSMLSSWLSARAAQLDPDCIVQLADCLLKGTALKDSDDGSPLELWTLAAWMLHCGARCPQAVLRRCPVDVCHSSTGSDSLLLKLLLDTGMDFPVPVDSFAKQIDSLTIGSKTIPSNPPKTKQAADEKDKVLSVNELVRTAKEGRLADCQQMLLDKRLDIHGEDEQGWTPLRGAAWAGQLAMIELLLQFGADANHVDSQGRSALRAASWAGHLDVVDRLLAAGAEPNLADNQGRSALMAASFTGKSECVSRLLRAGANPDDRDVDGRTALALCVQGNYLTTARRLLDAGGADANSVDCYGQSVLQTAAESGYLELCRLLLDFGAQPDPVLNPGGALLAAAANGYTDTVKCLLDAGAPADAMDSQGRTALTLAALGGWFELSSVLLAAGLDELHRDHSGLIAVHYAAAQGHLRVLDVLATRNAQSVLECDPQGRQALHMATQNGHLCCVKYLLQSGSLPTDPHRPCLHGETPLMLAAQGGHLEVCQQLLDFEKAGNAPPLCRAVPDAVLLSQDFDHRTALHFAVLYKHLGVVELLLSPAVTPDPLVSKCLLEARDANGRSALHLACYLHCLQMVQLLSSAGADPCSADADGRSCLMAAVWQGDVAAVDFLLKRGSVDVNHADREGATALHVAAQMGNQDIVALLLASHADAHLADICGRTAGSVAWISGHERLSQILQCPSPPNGSQGTRTSGLGTSGSSNQSEGAGVPVGGEELSSFTAIGCLATPVVEQQNNKTRIVTNPRCRPRNRSARSQAVLV